MAKKEINYRDRVKRDLDRLNKLDAETNSRIYGISTDFLNDNQEDNKHIREVISKVNEKNSKVTGGNIIEFFNASINETKSKNTKKAKKINNQDVFRHTLETVNNSGMINEIFYKEKERINLYNEYRLIDYYIPLVNQGLDALTDAIISPDDYTKEVFIYNYNENVDKKLDSTHNKVMSNLEYLNERYEIEDKARDWIHTTLCEGDKFIALLNYKNEFDSLITENGNILNESLMITEKDIVLNEAEDELLDEIFMDEEGELKDYNYKKEIVDMINENLEFTTNYALLYENEIKLKNDFVTPNKTFDNFESIKNKVTNGTSNNVNYKEIDDHIKKTLNNNGGNENIESKLKDLSINGTYIKELDNDRVIKLKLGSSVFGYYYVEGLESVSTANVNNVNRRYTDLQLRKSMDFMNTSDVMEDPKSKLIIDVFAKALSSKLDKKFIENNKEFKKVIYELIKGEYLINKKVRITYLSPDQVVHFMVKEELDGYGVSELKKIHFVSKLYLAVLICNLMMKLSRSVDHRAFYIETGVSADVENTIQSFIRDIKTKEVKLSDVQTIDTIFKSIGQFHDYCAKRCC